MANILQFPAHETQGLAFLERAMRERLTARGADEELITFATHQLTRTYERVRDAEQQVLNVSLPAGLADDQQAALEQEISRALDDLHGQNHRLLLELVAELVIAQVQLFQQRRSD